MNSRRILLTGGSGQLGTELVKLREYITPSHLVMDITDSDAVASGLQKYQPDVIVHAAAYTNTLLPETDSAAAALCYQTNVLGTRNLVKHAHCPIIYISTETALHPYNFYTLTKLQAEYEIKHHDNYQIMRTSFRYDPFEYPQAFTDMFTIGDSVAVIARLLDMAFDAPTQNSVSYVGTGVKTVYELARRTRPDVQPVRLKDLPYELPPMTELLNL